MSGLLLKIYRYIGIKLSFPAHYFFMKSLDKVFHSKLEKLLLESKSLSRNLIVSIVKPPSNLKILALSPHPDDETFGAGGLLLAALEKKCSIDIAFITTGKINTKEKVRHEAEQLSHTIGAKPHFLNYDPHAIKNSTIVDIRNLIEDISPDLVLLPFFMDDHDDHRRVNELLIELDEELVNVDIWAYQIYSTIPSNGVLDITNFVDKKIQLMSIYKNVSGERNWVHYILGNNAVASRYIPSKKKKYAELFFICPAPIYIEYCKKYFLKSFIVYKDRYYR